MDSVQRAGGSAVGGPSTLRETALNGDYNETTATIDLSDNSSPTGLPRMEDMLRVATDLQENSSLHDSSNSGYRGGSAQYGKLSFSETTSNSNPSLVGQGKGTVVQSNSAVKMDNIKKWSISTYKCTRQFISEKLGKGSRTVDEELDSQVALLRDTQKKYLSILRLSKQLTQQLSNMLVTQRSLGDCFSDLGLKTPDLQDEFNYNAETQKTLVRNGDVLLGALHFFTANVQTLCTKTIEDTMSTVKAYEAARIEFDAYRSDHQYYANSSPTNSTAALKADEAKKEFEQQKERFDRIRSDLTIKLKFLEENKAYGYGYGYSRQLVPAVKVMQRQLLLFHNATTAYFSGNKQGLENTIKEFHIKSSNKDTGQSFLEQK